MLRSSTTSLLSAVLIVLGLGCSGGGNSGPKTVPVSGKVTYKSQPVDGATVSFLGDGKIPPAVAITDSAGKFVLTTNRSGDGAVPGTHRVTVVKIVAPPSTPTKTKTSMEDAAKAAEDSSSTKPLSMLPEKYNSAETSGLQFEVKSSGSNVFEIPLTD